MKTVLVAAGPTRERIDPVRFISNRSTGAFGYEIAREALRRGMRAVLVSGPTELVPPKEARLVRVGSALEMRRAVMKELAGADFVVMAAAVCDWRPRRPLVSKIKRRGGRIRLELIENPDIAAEVGRKKGKRVLVGFALETETLERNAREKLKKKNLDIIVANMLSPSKDVFGPGKTDVVIIDRAGHKTAARNKSKRELAEIIVGKMIQ